MVIGVVDVDPDADMLGLGSYDEVSVYDVDIRLRPVFDLDVLVFVGV